MKTSGAHVQRLAANFLRTYPGALCLGYRFRQTTAEMFGKNAHLVDPLIKGGYRSLPLRVGARELQGRVDLLWSNADSALDIVKTLRHEVLGHFGLNTFNSSERGALLDAITRSNDPDIAQLWTMTANAYWGSTHRLIAEEVFCLAAESIDPSIYQRITNIELDGKRSMKEAVLSTQRAFTLADLTNVGNMVAHGLHDRTRTQQTFPENFLHLGKAAAAKKPYHEVVAENLIERLREGTAPWQRPWIAGQSAMPVNPSTGKRYRGINAIHLMAQNRADSRWLTYNQASSLGGQVRKGERGTSIQYWRFADEVICTDEKGKPVLDRDGKPIKDSVQLERPRVFFATVFNADQIDGLPAVKSQVKTWPEIERAENILVQSVASIRYVDGSGAYYSPAKDEICMPSKSQFADGAKYYGTALHELGHWTGHESRLARDLKNPFGSEAYAKEELRAEIASLIVGDELSIGKDVGQHAAYVKAWIKVLQEDPMEIFRAAADAEKIAALVMSYEQQQSLKQSAGGHLTPDSDRSGNAVAAAELARANEVEVNADPNSTADDRAQAKQERLSADAEYLRTQAVAEVQAAIVPGTEPLYLNVPFAEKDEAKQLGAKWDRSQQQWFVPSGVDVRPFERWTNDQSTTVSVDSAPRIYLAVPYKDREEAKRAGARYDVAKKSWYVDQVQADASIKKWLPQHVTHQQMPPKTPREEFSDLMRDYGLFVGLNGKGDHPIMDGKKHRVPASGGKGLDGEYRAYLDGRPAGYVMNYKTQEQTKWRYEGAALSDEERARLNADAAIRMQERAAAQAALEQEVAERISTTLPSLSPAPNDNAYLARKGISAQDPLKYDDARKVLVVAAHDVAGTVWTAQYIQEDGTKRFAKHGRKEGSFHALKGMGDLAQADVIGIVEGYATGGVLGQKSGLGVAVAFDSGNLEAVARNLRSQFPDKPIVIFGDDDRHLPMTLGINPGRAKAEAAAAAVDGTAVFPIFAPGEASYPQFIPPITPEEYKAHLKAVSILQEADRTTDQHEKAKNEIVDETRLTAIREMARFTDFNDLRVNSRLGQEGFERQVKAAIKAAMQHTHSQNVTQTDRYKVSQKTKHRGRSTLA